MHERPRPNWTSTPTDAWIGEGFRLLREEIKPDESEYRRILKKRLLASMTLAYWGAMVRHAELHDLLPRKTNDESTEQAIARALGMNAAQPGRWARGETNPDADKVFAALVVGLRSEIDEVGFPRNREVAWQMMGRTLSLIRKEDFKLNGMQPGREEVLCVWWFVRHPHSDVFLGRQRPATKEDIYEDVLKELSRHFPRSTLRSTAPAERAIDRWLFPYLVLRVGFLAGWEHIDDEAF